MRQVHTAVSESKIAMSKVQGKWYAYFGCQYLAHGDSLSKDFYWQQIDSHLWAFD